LVDCGHCGEFIWFLRDPAGTLPDSAAVALPRHLAGTAEIRWGVEVCKGKFEFSRVCKEFRFCVALCFFVLEIFREMQFRSPLKRALCR
jgi:hypothetical protein